MKFQLKLWQKGIIIIALPLVFELIFVFVLGALLHGVEVEARNTERSRNIVLEAEQIERVFFHAGAALASYQASKNPLFVLQYKQARTKIESELEVLERLCQDNKRQRAEMAEIGVHINRGLELLEEYRSRIERDDLAASPFDEQVKTSVLALGGTLAKIISNEKDVEIHRPQSERHLRQLVEQCLFAGIALNVLIAVGVSIYFSRGITRRLLILGANSERLAQKQVLLPEMPGSDEIAQLDSVFHRMAETLVEAARKERAVVDNAADVICSIDPQNRFAACNPAACKIWGFSENELLERNVLDIVDPDSAEETGAGFSKARRENSTSVFENRILTKDAQPIDMLWSVYWSEAEQRMFCVAHDISEQKRAERLRKEVLDMVTHDLRSPLASIDLSIDMLQQGYKGTISDQASGELEKIKRNSSRMMRLVNDLLDMEKLKEGKLKLVSKDVNLQVIVENAFDVVLPAANQRRIKLLEENTDIEIFADGVRVGQILINLLSNALKFSPENSVVKVAAESRENEIVVKVIDNGPGMTAEQAGRLFQRFSQLEAHLQQGSGLGLAICKALVDLHGGSIGVESEKGKGSTFWFSLPLNAPVPSPDLAR